MSSPPQPLNRLTHVRRGTPPFLRFDTISPSVQRLENTRNNEFSHRDGNCVAHLAHSLAPTACDSISPGKPLQRRHLGCAQTSRVPVERAYPRSRRRRERPRRTIRRQLEEKVPKTRFCQDRKSVV